jgi:hypothetical protein
MRVADAYLESSNPSHGQQRCHDDEYRPHQHLRLGESSQQPTHQQSAVPNTPPLRVSLLSAYSNAVRTTR